MSSLTETAYYARQGIKFGSVGLIALTLLWWIGGGVINLYKALNPEAPPPPAAAFGKLPPIEFPKPRATTTGYSLETPTGTLGKFPDRMKVYFAPVRKSSFLASDNAKKLALKMGFVSEPVIETSTRYRWSVDTPLPTVLSMDIVNGFFELKRSWQANPTIVTSKKFVSDEQSILDGKTFLTTAGLLAEDLRGLEKVTYLRAQGDQFVPTISLSEADFVRVDFFRATLVPPTLTPTPDPRSQPTVAVYKDENSYSFFTPDASEGLVSLVVSGSTKPDEKIIEVKYNYTPIDYESESYYPIKTVEQAFEELKTNKGYIASFNGSGQVVIRRVGLGYFDALTPHEYTMPVYVFTGDEGFVAYVSAVSEDVLEPTLN
jgi:hypothetical protein